MTHKHRRRFAFALVVCLLFGLLPGVSQAEQTQTPPVADAHAAETPESAVPATQTPTEPIELTEAETVSLSEDEVRVIKGGTTTLTAEIPEAERGESPLTTSSAIVWSSSNPAVATVDSNGVVTGIELGEATITATLNGSVIETFTVYSTLADGYYKIEDQVNTYCFYPEAVSMYYTVDVNIMNLEYSFETSSTLYDDLRRQWYIEYLDSGYYAIHPAYSSGMVLSLFGGTIPILQTADSTTLNYWQWSIVSSYGDYSFINRYYSDLAITFPELDGTSGPLTSDTYTSTSSQKWSLVSATVSPGLLLFDMRTGTLVADDLQYDSDEICSGAVDAYACLNQAYTLEEVGLYVSPLDPASYNQTHIIIDVQPYATFDVLSLKMTGTQVGQKSVSLQRPISGSVYSIDLSLTVKEAETVVVKYDYAYADRYSDYLPRINQQTQALAKKYRADFQIFLNVGTPVLFYSYGDTCSTNYLVDCDHGACVNSIIANYVEVLQSNYHHKNGSNILARLKEDERESDMILFTGHNTCREYDGAHGIGVSNGIASPYVRAALISNHSTLNNSAKTTIHEYGHILFAPDHYGIEDKPSTGDLNDKYGPELFSSNCIYGENRDHPYVVNNLIICEGCCTMILYGEEGLLSQEEG